MAWHDIGTVSVTLNSNTVTGVGTNWLLGARSGDAFVAPDGRLYEVLNIASSTSLTLTSPYLGPTKATQKYALAPMQGYVKSSADKLAAVVDEIAALPTRVSAVEDNKLDASKNLSDLKSVQQAQQNLGFGSMLTKAGNLAGLVNQAAARSNLGLKSAALADLLGDVGDGAAMQTGSNANGVWWRFANGLQVCFQNNFDVGWSNVAQAGFFSGIEKSWTYPHAYASTPFVGGFVTGGWSDAWLVTGGAAVSKSAAAFTVKTMTPTTNLIKASLVAIGKI